MDSEDAGEKISVVMQYVNFITRIFYSIVRRITKRVLIGTFTMYQTAEKAQRLRNKLLIEEFNMVDVAPKSVVIVCMHKFACTNVTPTTNVP